MYDSRRAYSLLMGVFTRYLGEHWLALVAHSVGLPILLVSLLDAFPFAPHAAPGTVALIGGVAALLGVALLDLPSALARMRASGQITFFAALPIESGAWLAALLSVYGLAAAPGMILAPTWALWQTHQVIYLSLWLAPLGALSFAAFAGVGAALGVVARGYTAAGALGNVTYFVILAGMLLLIAAPPLVPVARVASLLFPASLSVDALSATQPDSGDHAIAADILLLACYAALGLYIAYRALPWRATGKPQVAPQPHP